MNKFIVLSLALLAIFGAVQAQNLGGFLDQAASLATGNTANSVSNTVGSSLNSASNTAAANIDANPSATDLASAQIGNLNVSTNGVQNSLDSAAATAGNAVGAAVAQPTDSYNALAGDLNSLINQAEGQTVSSVEGTTVGVANSIVSLENTVQAATDSFASSLGLNLTATTSDLLNQLNNATGIVTDIKNISSSLNASALLNNATMILAGTNLSFANLSDVYANFTNNFAQVVDLNAPYNGTYLQCVEDQCQNEINSCYADNFFAVKSCRDYYAEQQLCFQRYECDTFNTSTQNCYDVCLNTTEAANDAPFASLNACALKKCTYAAVLNSSGVYDILGNFFSSAYVNASTAALTIANSANSSELYNNVTSGVNISAIAMNSTMFFNNETGISQSYLNLTSMGPMNMTNGIMVDGETLISNLNMTVGNAAMNGVEGLTNASLPVMLNSGN